ncbi:hypothetical protein LOK74_05100 [Brevibacillus humidisoli]|uniref:hypothetical protein n=1 Tax=Brevibacillus humidisoli TaxID=2895522 RepID=UPI001E46E813|nr:hypothetical protein [Brevibacillus humidisoli]UFJ41883.1 hypothetical protein LOK74_05100 [Brevibacillus humidisoli]
MKQLKKSWNKPVVAVLAVATIAGGITPVWANADKGSKAKDAADVKVDQEHKIVLGADGDGYTRYELKDLLENEALFNLLLSTHADDLYLIIDEINFEMKLTTFMEEYEDNWEELLAEYDGDIYVEVRFDEEEGFIKLEQEIKDDNVYIKGKVAADVNKVVITKPSGDKIEIVNFEDQQFSVSFPASDSEDDEYVTLQAYVYDQLVETEKLKVNNDDQVEEDTIIYTMGLYDQTKQEVKVKGIVSAEADQVYVRYGDKEKEATLNSVWEGVASFSAAFEADEDGDIDEATVEAYKDGDKIDAQTVALLTVNQPDGDDDDQLEGQFEIEASASITPRYKQVHVEGSITESEEEELGDLEGELELYATAPDGQRHQITLTEDGTFKADLSYRNRSFSAKAVHLQLYSGTTLVAEKYVPHGEPLNPPGPGKLIPGKGKGKVEGKSEVKVEVNGKSKKKAEKKNGKWQVKSEGGLAIELK